MTEPASEPFLQDLLARMSRAQKLAQESNSALETYQKQVKMLEERNVALVAKQTTLYVNMQSFLPLAYDELTSW